MPWRLPTRWALLLPSPPLWPCTCPNAPSSLYLQWSQNRALCQAEVTWLSYICVQRHHLSCTWSQGAEDAVSPTHVLSSTPTLHARPRPPTPHPHSHQALGTEQSRPWEAALKAQLETEEPLRWMGGKLPWFFIHLFSQLVNKYLLNVCYVQKDYKSWDIIKSKIGIVPILMDLPA